MLWIDGYFVISYPCGKEVAFGSPLLPLGLDLSLQELVDLLLAHVPKLTPEGPLLVSQLLGRVGPEALF